MSDNQSCHVRHPIRACFGVSCSCLCKLSFIKLACSFRLSRLLRLVSVAHFYFEKQNLLALGNRSWVFPTLINSLWLVIKGSFVSKIWQQVTSLSFWRGWSGLRDSFVLFGYSLVTSSAYKFSGDFITSNTDQENRSNVLFCFNTCLF